MSEKAVHEELQANPFEDPEVARAPEPKFAFELRALGGGAAVGLTKSSYPVVDYGATVFGAGVRAGRFIGPYVQWGLAASIVRYSHVGELEVRDAETFSDESWFSDTSFTAVSPLGGFMEIYPTADKGFFLNVSGSLGYVPPPAPPSRVLSRVRYLAGYAFEAGYETSRLRHGFGAFLRFSGWTGAQSFLSTDFPEGLDWRELTLGLRWTLRP